jgi:phosphotransferase system IIB component
LVFRGAVSPTSYGENDTLFSTRSAFFINPVRIFAGAQPAVASNGLVYTTSQMNYELHESFIKPIKVEAESSIGRHHNESYDYSRLRSLRVRDVSGVSNSAYLEVRDVSGMSPSVSFELPNVLAAEYDIYIVCLAQSYVEKISEINPAVTRLRFDIEQWNRVTDKSKKEAWKYYRTFSDQTTSQYVTNPEGITKMLVTKNFKFPFANINEPESVFRIKVFCELGRYDQISSTAVPRFQREVRIDYILLEASR